MLSAPGYRSRLHCRLSLRDSALLAAFVVLCPLAAFGQEAGLNPSRLPGIVVDNLAAKVEGTWTKSVHTRPFVGDGYIHTSGGAGNLVKFPVEINETGPYQVLVSYQPGTNRTTKAAVIVPTADGPKTFVLDQQSRPVGPYCFQPLGEVELVSGQHEIVISAEGNEKGVVIADAVQILTPDGFAAYKADFEKNTPKLADAIKADAKKPAAKKAAAKKAEEKAEPPE